MQHPLTPINPNQITLSPFRCRLQRARRSVRRPTLRLFSARRRDVARVAASVTPVGVDDVHDERQRRRRRRRRQRQDEADADDVDRVGRRRLQRRRRLESVSLEKSSRRHLALVKVESGTILYHCIIKYCL